MSLYVLWIGFFSKIVKTLKVVHALSILFSASLLTLDLCEPGASCTVKVEDMCIFRAFEIFVKSRESVSGASLKSI
jgi:hypothetical protein